MDLALNNQQRLICHKTNQQQIFRYMYKQAMALNNPQELIYH